MSRDERIALVLNVANTFRVPVLMLNNTPSFWSEATFDPGPHSPITIPELRRVAMGCCP